MSAGSITPLQAIVDLVDIRNMCAHSPSKCLDQQTFDALVVRLERSYMALFGPSGVAALQHNLTGAHYLLSPIPLLIASKIVQGFITCCVKTVCFSAGTVDR